MRHNAREEGEEEQGEDALGSEWQGGGWEESEPGGRRNTESAEMVEAAQRAGNPRVETGAGTRRGAGEVRGGWLRRNTDQGLSVAHSPPAHPARTVLPLAKSQLLYRSRSDPPNWLLMTP